jgi:hypothetical protein
LLIIPQTAALERIELDANISLIVTKPQSNYYILSLINGNNHNITLVENIQVNFSHEIDPTLVQAIDNYNKSVVPDEIKQRSITFTYNNTLPALGYGKIFLDLNSPKQVSTTAPPITSPPPTSLPPTSAPVVTSPPPLFETNPPIESPQPEMSQPSHSDVLEESKEEPEEPEEVPELPLTKVGIVVLLLLVAIGAVLTRILIDF